MPELRRAGELKIIAAILERPVIEKILTHLGCRSARYTPARGSPSCSPANAPRAAFPVSPGGAMPAIEGCAKQDYSVLIVIGVAVQNDKQDVPDQRR